MPMLTHERMFHVRQLDGRSQQQQRQRPKTRTLSSTMLSMLLTSRNSIVLVVIALFCQHDTAGAFPGAFVGLPAHGKRSSITRHWGIHFDRLSNPEADFVELSIGGARYDEMVPLPDSMVATTLFVGNLCEFVHDEDLSNLFQMVSVLHSVPACVARKPDMTSLQYGFVSFPTVQEKEAAILRFHGQEWQGRRIKVEPISDSPGKGRGRKRVRVPERIVNYVVGTRRGPERKQRKNKHNRIRPLSHHTEYKNNNDGPAGDRTKSGVAQTPNDVESGPLHRRELNGQEKAELERAVKRGYVTLSSRSRRTGSWSSSRGSSHHRRYSSSLLADAHRQLCDAMNKPQIILYKAAGGTASPRDQICVDLSPLRLHDGVLDRDQVDGFLVKWKADIVVAANNAGMDEVQTGSSLRDDNVDHPSELEDDRYNDEEFDEPDEMNVCVVVLDEEDRDTWSFRPISSLPAVRLGVFEGERSNAKAMGKELATIWGIIGGADDKNNNDKDDDDYNVFDVANHGGHHHRKSRRQRFRNNQGGRLSMSGEYRKRGGGHRQAYW